METTPTPTLKPDAAKPETTGGKSRQISAAEKCKAVLAVWTEKETVSSVCRRLAIQRPQLVRWEELALEGMLRSLEEPRTPSDGPGEAGLSRRLTKLLEKRLPQRLDKLTAMEAKVAKAVRKHSAAGPKPSAGN